MLSRFFIDRPVFAWALAILVMMAGVLAINTLPVAMFPPLAPPAVTISAVYPGASAATVERTVVQVIEQQMSGLDHLEYMSSQSNKDGSFTVTLTFAQGTDPDIAQVQVQNKLQLATPLLPKIVQQQGLKVTKSTKNFLIIVGLVSTDNRMSGASIADFIASHMQDPLSRTAGVGDVQLFGSQRAMRIWLDPAKLDNYSLTPRDVVSAIQAQNVQVATGELGGLPAVPGQQLNATLIGPSYMQTPEQFGQILLRVEPDGSSVRLRNVARIGFGPEDYTISATYDGHPTGGIAIKLASGANALDTISAVKATVNRLKPTFPPGLNVIYPYDTGPNIARSVRAVMVTLSEAIGLVFVVMLLFLQNVRATLVPTIAVPVVLLGTCAVLSAFGYSINTLTLFGMVLAIGLLIDDAIVVVENVERVMKEEGLPPKEATRRSMEQITGALIGIALVLAAVFVPMAFFGGSAGVIYRQFSITIATSMILSVLVALIFAPALCATLLAPPGHRTGRARGPFGWFDRLYDRVLAGYHRRVTAITHRPGRAFAVLAIVAVILVLGYLRLPGGFLPDEDQGFVLVQVMASPGATASHVSRALEDVSRYLLTRDRRSVAGVFEVSGFNFAGNGQNAGLCIVKLRPWDERSGKVTGVQQIANQLNRHFAGDQDAVIMSFIPPAAVELGNATGFDFELLDVASLGHEALMRAAGHLVALAARDPTLANVRLNVLPDEPQYGIEIDREKASALGVSIADINDTMQSAWGSLYVGQFLDHGRVKRVFLEGDAASRMLPQDLDWWYVRNDAGQMVPFSAFASGHWTYGSPSLQRYNGMPAIEIMGEPARGYSAGQAMAAMQRLAARMPAGIGYQWTGLSYEQQAAGSKTALLYGLSLAVVFLCLAALYESWAIPAAVLLVVPLGVVGAVLATLLRGMDNDIYFQVGVVTLIGLSVKNAILIVEFAKQNHELGQGLVEAAIEAARQRLRPILMTSLAFIFGVVPLAIATGPGSGGQNAIGTGVVGGMLTATALAIFLVPAFFVAVLRFVESRRGRTAATGVPQDVGERK